MIEKNKLMQYFEYCKYQKKLDSKSLKAYRIDITQFFFYLDENDVTAINRSTIEHYIEHLSKQFKVATVKRKYASIVFLFIIPYLYRLAKKFSKYKKQSSN